MGVGGLIVRRFIALSVKHTILILFLLSSLIGCGPDQTEVQRKRAEKAETALRHSESMNDGLLLFLAFGVVAMIFVVRYLNKKQVVIRTPAHEIVSNSFVIDARNVVHCTGPDQLPSLLVLVGLLLELHRRNVSYTCFFDANTEHKFRNANRNNDAVEYRALCREFKDQFVEVPGGNRADNFILDWAHSQGTIIISNDKYREFFSIYSWLENDKNRRVSFAVHNGIIQIYPLGIQAYIPTNLTTAVSELRSALRTQMRRS